MSFGYSVSDCIAGANLTYRLIEALRETKGSSHEFQQAMTELGSLQQMFLTVGQMRASPSLDIATINAASVIVLSSMELIGNFLERTKAYRKRLSNDSAPAGVSNSWQKIGWALFKRQELESLRDVLHNKLNHLNLLLSAANFWGQASLSAGRVSQYQDGGQRGHSDQPSSPMDKGPADNQAEDSVDQSLSRSLTFKTTPGTNRPGADLDRREDPVSPQDRTLVSDAATVVTMLQAKTETLMERIAESDATIMELTENVAKLAAYHETSQPSVPDEKQKPIKFRDAVGRQFSFPFRLCRTWEGMEDLIRQAFLHVDIVSEPVFRGLYDLIGPSNDIILPGVWESVIEPGWTITMEMWLMPEETPIEAVKAIGELMPPSTSKPVKENDDLLHDAVRARKPIHEARQFRTQLRRAAEAVSVPTNLEVTTNISSVEHSTVVQALPSIARGMSNVPADTLSEQARKAALRK